MFCDNIINENLEEMYYIPRAFKLDPFEENYDRK